MSVATSCLWVFMTTPLRNVGKLHATTDAAVSGITKRHNTMDAIVLGITKNALAAVTNYFSPVRICPITTVGKGVSGGPNEILGR
jgi:hypothetical protein